MHAIEAWDSSVQYSSQIAIPSYFCMAFTVLDGLANGTVHYVYLVVGLFQLP